MSDRSVDNARLRNRRPPEARYETLGRRRADAGIEYVPDDLLGGRADRGTLFSRHAAARRSDPDWHTRRRRHAAQKVSACWRDSAPVDRGHRRVFAPDGGSGKPMIRVRVLRKSQEAIDICSFELARIDGGNLPAFSAG